MKHLTLNQGEIDIAKFKKGKRISRGGFGIVYQVEEKKTGELFAAKVIDCDDDDEDKCNQMIKREISIMINAQHPTIIKFIGYSKKDFQEENNITIIMELASKGSLKSVLKKIQEHDGPKDYTNTSRQIILVGVARGMKYLHDRNIIHRDLKADNILLDGDFHPRITDFGLSKNFEAGHSRSQTKFGGTLAYEAPEILKKKEYDIKVDVYSFAILMYEVLTDSVPYPELEKEEIAEYKFINKVVKKNYRPKFNVPIKKSFKNLIEKCWSNDPNERPTFGEIFDKLSNKNNNEDDDDDDDDFLLDDVDVDELNLYVEDITEVTDFTEKLLKRMNEMEARIKEVEKENQKLKTENMKQRNKIEKYENEKKKLIDEIKMRNMDDFNQAQMEAENKQLKKEIINQQSIINQYEKDKKKLMDELNQTKQELEEYKRELNQSKDSLDDIKSTKKGYTQYNIVGGYNEFNQLGENSNNKNKHGTSIISPPIKSSFDPSSLLSYSAYYSHSVLVTSDGSLKGVGDNSGGQISSTLQKTIINNFTDFCIKNKSGHLLSAISAVCNEFGTLYMFSKSSGNERQLVLCDYYIKGGNPIFLDIGNHHPVSLFGGRSHSAAIGSEGEIIFINRYSVKKSPKSPIAAVYLPEGEKASSIACCDELVVVLSSNGRVFSSKIESNRVLKFSPVLELSGQEIVCVSGTYRHCLAVSKEGRVFVRGSNEHGQLCLGEGMESVRLFIEILSLVEYKIRAAYAGFSHSLFETREGKILSCGSNFRGQLLLSIDTCEKVYSPTVTMITSGASFCIAGNDQSAVFIGSGTPENTPNVRIQQT